MKDEVKNILNRASHDIKHDYRIYNMYRQELMDLNLEHREYTEAVVELAVILEV